jgi:hypothetical protein
MRKARDKTAQLPQLDIAPVYSPPGLFEGFFVVSASIFAALEKRLSRPMV